MEEKERLEKLEPGEALADREEKAEPIEAGSGRKDRREAGFNMDGELSVEAVRRWLLWAGLALGICLAASCILGTVFFMQNRKPAMLLTLDGKDSRELVLNRKGGVIRKNGNPDSMAGLSLRECCDRLLEELHGAQLLEDQEAALFTVRPIEGAVRVDTERTAEEIAIAAELFLTTRQAKGTVYAGGISEKPEILELARENGCSVGKAAMVRDLLERNVRVRESDCGRLCQMDMGALYREMKQKNYQTSFLEATAGKLYQVKEDRPAGTESGETADGEPGTETDGSSGAEEEKTEAGKSGSGAGSPSRDRGFGQPAGGAEEETVKEGQEGELPPEEDSGTSRGEDTSPEELENGEASGTKAESESRGPSETGMGPEEAETTAPPEASKAAPETTAPPETSEAVPETAAEPETPAAPETSAPAAGTAAPEPSTAAPGTLTPVSPTPEETPAPETEPPRPPETPPATEPHTVGPGILEDVVPAG